MNAQLALYGGTPVRTDPFPRWPVFDDAELASLKEVLLSGIWGIGGKKVPLLEEQFAAYHNARYAVAAVNGTATLEMALRAFGVKEGDEVIIPPYTFYATMSAVLVLKAVPVFVDIENDSYCIDLSKVPQAITERTKAIIPVLFAGCPVDVDSMNAIACPRGIHVLLDAAQAHATEWQGKRVGALGDICSFSFQSSKNMTSGEGGMLTTDDESLAALARSYGNCGRDQKKPWYEHYRLGNNFRMTEFQAAILLCQLPRLGYQTSLRHKNASRLSARLSEIPGIVPLAIPPGATRHTHHILVLKYYAELFDEIPRGKLLAALQAEGIPAHPGYVPLYRSPMFANKEVDPDEVYKSSPPPDPGNFPITEQAAGKQAVWLPHNILLGDESCIRDVVDAFSKVWDNRDKLASTS